MGRYDAGRIDQGFSQRVVKADEKRELKTRPGLPGSRFLTPEFIVCFRHMQTVSSCYDYHLALKNKMVRA